MWSFVENRFFSRLLIYGMALLIIAGSLMYSNYLVRQLSKEESKTVQLKADALKFVGTAMDSDCEMDFVIEHLVKPNEIVPIIITDDAGSPVMDRNLEIGEDCPPEERAEKVQIRLNQMKKSGKEPIKIEIYEGIYQYVYHDDSSLLKQLRWFPLLQLFIIMIFIGIVFMGFAVAKRNEQNRVWVGLAKETAHQLGTPISSLMAWLELLKMNAEGNPDDEEMLEEMERDVFRLEGVAERFSKIGSEPEFVRTPVKEVLDRGADYIGKRMSKRSGVVLEVNNRISAESQLEISPQLFEWVIENLLKNALDAMEGGKGKITIEAKESGSKFYIEVTDTGKGIPRGKLEKVFEPGFTTKKRGWGLGLSLTRRIVQNYHRGKIYVSWSEVGKGTTFRIVLPKRLKKRGRRDKK